MPHEPEIFVGNFTIFRLHVTRKDGRDVDLQGLSGSALEIVFNRPVSAPVLVTGELTPATDPEKVDGEDGRYEYQVISSAFLNEDGDWTHQGHVTLAGGAQYSTRITAFEVFARLPTP